MKHPTLGLFTGLAAVAVALACNPVPYYCQPGLYNTPGSLNGGTCTYSMAATATTNTNYYCNAPATLTTSGSTPQCVQTTAATRKCNSGTLQSDGRCLTVVPATRSALCRSGYTAFLGSFSTTDTPCYPNSFSCGGRLGVNPSNVVGCYVGYVGQAHFDPVTRYSCYATDGGVSTTSRARIHTLCSLLLFVRDFTSHLLLSHASCRSPPLCSLAVCGAT